MTFKSDTYWHVAGRPVRGRQRPRAGIQELNIFSSVVDQVAEGVLITDREGVIKYVNTAFERLTGYSRAEAVGRNPSILKSGLEKPEVYERLWKTILAGGIYREVLINRKKNGDIYHEEKIITPIFDSLGQITHFVSTGRDVSEHRRAEAALAESERSLREVNAVRREFFAMVAHELNSPLTAATGAVDLLLETATPPLPPHQADYLRIAARNLERIGRLTADLTDLAKVECGTFSVTRRPTNLTDCVRSACHSVAGSVREKGFEFSCPTDSAPTLLANVDADRLEQVILNLVENAARYATSRVSVDVRDCDPVAQIVVENDGPELLDPHNRLRIFDAKVQIATCGKPKGRCGLGLPIAKGIVEAHGGDIRVENISTSAGCVPGVRGVRFIVELPALSSM